MFIIEKQKSKSIARKLENYDKKMKTDFKVLDKNGKCIIKKMDAKTFALKFG